MTDFLRKTISPRRFATYADLAARPGETRSPEDLYGLNILYSKELYAVLAALEIVVRNAFNDALKRETGRDEWFTKVNLEPKHQTQINDAVDFLTRHKKADYVVDDIIAQLNFGFWAHLCDRPYEKSLWNRALYKCFPYLGQKPNRGDIERRLNGALRLRNKVAHLEPVIKYESTLIQDYRNITQLLYAISPETQKWFQIFCHFEDIWNKQPGRHT